MGTLIGIIIVFWVLSKLFGGSSSSQTQDATSPAEGDTVKCPVCGGEAVVSDMVVFAECKNCNTAFFTVQEDLTGIFNIMSLVAKIMTVHGNQPGADALAVFDGWLEDMTPAQQKLCRACLQRLLQAEHINIYECVDTINNCGLDDKQKLSIVVLLTNVAEAGTDKSTLAAAQQHIATIAEKLGVKTAFQQVQANSHQDMQCPFCFEHMQGDRDTIITCPACGRASFQGNPANNYVICVVTLAAVITKADGQVTKREIDCLDRLLTDAMKLSVAERQLLANWFNSTVRQNVDYRTYMQVLKNEDAEYLQTIFSFFIELAYIENQYNQNKQDILNDIGHTWNISPDFFDYCVQQLEKEWNLEDCYRILECSPGDSFETVKKMYRKLVMKFHPDKYANKNLSAAERDKMQKRFIEIRQAYEQIKNTVQQ